MENFFLSLKVGIEKVCKTNNSTFYLRQDGFVLVQDPISLQWVIYATNINNAAYKASIKQLEH